MNAPDADTILLLMWLAGVAVLLGLGVAAFGYVLLRRNRDWLTERLQWVERQTERIWPWGARFLQARLNRAEWHGLTLTFSVVVFVGLVALFAAITEGWLGEEGLYTVDRAVHRAIGGALRPWVIDTMHAITYLGDIITTLLVAGVLVVVFVRRKAWEGLLALVLVLGVGEGILWGMKFIFARSRPESPLVTAAGASFPSGHTFTATVLWGFVLFLIWRWSSEPWVRGLATVLCVSIMLLVGMSRILLSVHWVSDVLGGLTIGLAWLVTSLVLARAVAARQGWRGEGWGKRFSNVE